MVYSALRAFIWAVVRAGLALLGGLRVEGRGNVPRRGAVILAPNHISDADPPVVGVAAPRPLHYMAKQELFRIPVLGTLIRLMHGFPVRRGQADRTALRRAEALLQAGQAVVVFPEGQLSESGVLQPLNGGIVFMAMHAQAPVIPVGISGTDRLLPYGHLVPRRAGRPIVVRFGAPIPAHELTGGRKGRDAIEHGVALLSARLAALVEEPQRAPAPAHPQPAAGPADLPKAGFGGYGNENT